MRSLIQKSQLEDSVRSLSDITIHIRYTLLYISNTLLRSSVAHSVHSFATLSVFPTHHSCKDLYFKYLSNALIPTLLDYTFFKAVRLFLLALSTILQVISFFLLQIYPDSPKYTAPITPNTTQIIHHSTLLYTPFFLLQTQPV